MKRTAFLLLAIFVAFAPAPVLADDGELQKGFVLRVDGDLHIGPDESLEVALVINGEAVIEGEVKETLIIIAGSAVVSGRVGEDVVLIDSDLELTANGRIDGDVVLISGDISRGAGSVVGGVVRDELDFSIRWWDLAIFSLLAWVGFTILVIFSGLLFVAVGSRQMSGAAALLTDDAGFSILAAVFIFMAVPIPAFFILITGVGTPLGFGILFFLLPAIGFLGYLIAGLRLGNLIVHAARARTDNQRPYLPAFVGLTILQLVVLVPFFGWFVAFLMSFWGAGGLVLYAWRAWRAPKVGAGS